MYRRRILIFLALIGLAMTALAARLWQMQVINGQDYRRQFEENLRKTDLLPAKRGLILDRNDQVLAQDKPCFDFSLDYRLLVNDAKWRSREQRKIMIRLGVGADEAAEIFDQLQAGTWAMARRLANENQVDLDETVDRICSRIDHIKATVGGEISEESELHAIVRGLENQVNLEGTIGADCVASLKRWYPRDDLASHVIGVVGQVAADAQREHNLPKDQPWANRVRNNYFDGDITGLSGAERAFEATLRGQRGYRRTRRSGEIIDMVPAVNGRDVHLTIDAALQEDLTNLMGAKGYQGAIVVLSVPTGEVLALVSVPTYNLNRYSLDYATLGHDEVDLPLLNRAVARRYPPGSTAKPISAIAGLSSGATSIDTTYTCYGCLDPAYPDDWKCMGHHGTLSLVDAIQHSCNVYFYHVGMAAGPVALSEWFGNFGYTDKPGTGLPEEVAGKAPREVENRGDVRLWAIGQGKVEATPLHVANEMATIARDGKFLSPTVVVGGEGGPPRISRDLGIKPEHMRAVQRGMYEVVNEPGGTGYKVFRDGASEKLDVIVCGKTGTADVEPQRVDSNGNGRIDSEDRVVRTGNMAWFAGYAPYVGPRIAFAVVLEYVEGYGGTLAGPVARQVVGIIKNHGYFN